MLSAVLTDFYGMNAWLVLISFLLFEIDVLGKKDALAQTSPISPSQSKGNKIK
jgi:hypothetical protein